jgi:hypothetical protein
MGRRSRKRATSPVAPPRPAGPPTPAPRTGSAPRAATYKARREDAPKPAWAPVPLTELCILIAIVLLALGFFSHGDRRGPLLAGGIVLVTLAGGELALREHFAGYRSHSSLLAGACAVLGAAAVSLLPVPRVLVLVVAALAGGLAFVAFRNAFKRRSGGVGFKV